MEFDNTRYVAPGVPRISRNFAKFIKAKEAANEKTPMDICEYMGYDTYLRPLRQNRRRTIINSKDRLVELDAREAIEFTEREYLINAALGQQALVYAGNRGVALHEVTGLPDPELELAIEFLTHYLAKAKSKDREGGSAYLIEDMTKSDKLLAKLLRRDWKKKIRDSIEPHHMTDLDKRMQWIIEAGAIGSINVLKYLIKQNEVYRLNDQLKA